MIYSSVRSFMHVRAQLQIFVFLTNRLLYAMMNRWLVYGAYFLAQPISMMVCYDWYNKLSFVELMLWVCIVYLHMHVHMSVAYENCGW